MNRWVRLLRHRLWDADDVRRQVGEAALARLAERAVASERRHRGEIRLCLEGGLPLSYLWRGLPPRARAVTLFGKLRVWDTEANNGVLIYLLLAERAIEIVADRGLARRVPEADWAAMVDGMRAAFRAGRYEEGLAQAIDRVDALLVQHFPAGEGGRDLNELPDTVVVL